MAHLNEILWDPDEFTPEVLNLALLYILVYKIRDSQIK